MVNNKVPRSGEDPDQPVREDIPAGSDAEEIRHEVPGEPQPTIDQTPDQPETIATPDARVRSPGQGPGDPTQFNRNPAAPDKQPALPKASPKWGMGVIFMMGGTFFLIIAVIVIVWIAM